MNFSIINERCFVVRINNSYLELKEEDIYDKLKKVLINIRKRYAYDIYGFYDVEIYEVKNFITILKFYKKDDDELFRNTIDLKINKINRRINIVFDDYFLINKCQNIDKDVNKYKINSELIKKEEIIKLCEHYKVEQIDSNML